MPHREIDSWIKKGFQYTEMHHESQATAAKERVWSKIEKKNRYISWGLLSAMAASLLLFLVCGILFLQVKKQQRKMNEFSAHIYSLEAEKELIAKRALQAPFNTPDKEPASANQSIAPFKQQLHTSKEPESESTIPVTYSEPMLKISRSPIEIPVPEVELPSPAVSIFKPAELVLQGLADKEPSGSKPQKPQKLKIRLGNQTKKIDQNQSLALLIKL